MAVIICYRYEVLHWSFAVTKIRGLIGAGIEVVVGGGMVSKVLSSGRTGAGVLEDTIRANTTPTTRATTQVIRDAMTVTDMELSNFD